MKNEKHDPTVYPPIEKNIGGFAIRTLLFCALFVITFWSLFAPLLDPLFENVHLLMDMRLSDIDNYFEDLRNQIKAIVTLCCFGSILLARYYYKKWKRAE